MCTEAVSPIPAVLVLMALRLHTTNVASQHPHTHVVKGLARLVRSWALKGASPCVCRWCLPVIAPRQVVPILVAGAIAEAGANQAGDMMQVTIHPYSRIN